jgi:diacylglycerol kinase family enzyme
MVSEKPQPSSTGLVDPGKKARMLLIVNPKATTVSNRLKNLITYALQARYEVDALETEDRNHATELARHEAVDGYDIVVAFGGDGTVNEAANGLAGSGVPLSVLPGGCTNVVCRMLGIPTDVVDASEHLLALADDLRPRPIDLGRVNGRYFVASAGVGLDADTTRWVDQRSHLKQRAGPLFFSYAALMSFYGKYLGRPPRFEVETNGDRVKGVTAVVQNSDPFTYFNDRPVRVCTATALDDGCLSMSVLERASQRDVPALAWKLLTNRGSVSDHSQVRSFANVYSATVRALPRDGELLPFPLQVDGDYIAEYTEVKFEICPGALLVVS